RLGNELGQELAHRPRRQEILPALGCAETRQVNGEQAGVLGKRGPHPRGRVDAFRPRTCKGDRWRLRGCAVGVPEPAPVDSPEADLWGRRRWHAAILQIRVNPSRARPWAPSEVPGQLLADRAGAKNSVSSWVTRSASS